jgi:dihydroorotate dehydrogenase electron transfer subunit
VSAQPRTPAPFGRRTLTVAARRVVGAYAVLAADDPEGPIPRAGQFYMLSAARRWGGGADDRPFLPRAFSVMRASDDRLEFMLEAVGPGTERLCEPEP